MYVIVWEFVPRASRRSDFERAYGPRGRWVEFFRRGEGYHGTELWRAEGRYLTVDRWQSEDAYRRFRAEQRAAYEEIDREMEELTEREVQIGTFTVV
jgi:heme-degrading monooxygenase HmoA